MAFGNRLWLGVHHTNPSTLVTKARRYTHFTCELFNFAHDPVPCNSIGGGGEVLM